MARSDTQPQEEGRIGLGELLRRAREERGLSLEQVAHETKIPVQRLAAFEADDLPGDRGFYHRAQVRAYARAVHLGESVVNAELDRAEPSALPPAQPPVVRAEPSRNRPIAIAAIAIGTAAAILGGAIVTQKSSDGPELNTPVPAQRAEPDRVAPAVSFEQLAAEPVESRPVQTSHVSSPEPAPEPTKVPVPAPPVSELIVTTQPAGARITVNGIGWGTTPITIRHLDAGDKRVRVTLAGYAADERVVHVSADRPARLNVQLRPEP